MKSAKNGLMMFGGGMLIFVISFALGNSTAKVDLNEQSYTLNEMEKQIELAEADLDVLYEDIDLAMAELESVTAHYENIYSDYEEAEETIAKSEELIQRLDGAEEQVKDLEEEYEKRSTEIEEELATRLADLDSEVEKRIKELDSGIEEKEDTLETLEAGIKIAEEIIAEKNEIIKAKETEPITLSAGQYFIGRDVPVSRYKVKANGRGGNFVVYNDNGRLEVNTILGDGDYKESEYIFYGLEDYYIDSNTSFTLTAVE